MKPEHIPQTVVSKTTRSRLRNATEATEVTEATKATQAKQAKRKRHRSDTRSDTRSETETKEATTNLPIQETCGQQCNDVLMSRSRL